MKFRALHGVHEPEATLGAEFTVDVQVQTDISLAAEMDELAATVNYETIHQIVQLEMDKPRKLVETVVTKIIRKLKKQFPMLMGLRVRVRKHNPPLGGRVDSTWVEEEDEFLTACPRCGSPMICYRDDTCWCKDENTEIGKLHPATREAVKRQFKKCLCQACTQFFAN